MIFIKNISLLLINLLCYTKIMKFNPAPGMKDLFKESSIYQKLEKDFLSLCELNGLSEVRTPILENKELFVRSVGESSDIVEKEMFECGDLVLRPENTAPIARAFLSQNLNQGKYCYFAPQFRKERPQKGRYRQFYQYGFELFGETAPQLEIESLLLVQKLYQTWNLSSFEIQVNFLGNFTERENYLKVLTDYFTSNQDKLSEQSQKRLTTNVLRILDSKEVIDQALILNAPSILNSLSEESKTQWQNILSLCQACNIPVVVNDRLVRGLDYYTGMVFEVVDTSGNLGSQKALGGGGRYDKLCEDLGGKSTPAFGFAGGVERLILALNLTPEDSIPKPICLITNEPSIVPSLIMKKQSSNIYVDVCVSPSMGFKKMFKRADRLGSQYVVILGTDELSKGCLKIKDMSSGEEVITATPLEQLDLINLSQYFKK